MTERIDTAGLRQLLEGDGGARVQLVEVLPEKEYGTEHLPGALHVPLTGMTRRAVADALDPSRPVVVYCFDFQ